MNNFDSHNNSNDNNNNNLTEQLFLHNVITILVANGAALQTEYLLPPKNKSCSKAENKKNQKPAKSENSINIIAKYYS